MSNFEQIFCDPGPITLHQAASTLAAAIRCHVSEFQGLLTLSASAREADVAADVGGTLEHNVYAEQSPASADERSIFDPLPLVFEFRVSKQDFELQGDVARVLYERMVEALGWVSALTSEYSELVAAFDPERGLRWFEPGTLSDGTHEHLWG